MSLICESAQWTQEDFTARHATFEVTHQQCYLLHNESMTERAERVRVHLELGPSSAGHT